MTTTANEIVVQSQSDVATHDVEALVQAAVSVLTNDMQEGMQELGERVRKHLQHIFKGCERHSLKNLSQIATHDQTHVSRQDHNTVQLLVDTCASNSIQDRLYMCTDCNLAFYGEQGEQEWQWHLKQHKPYKCDLCSEAFEQKESLKVHMRSHTMQMPFICEKCGSAYSLKTNLVQHMKTHEEKLYQCGECSVIFKTQANLEKHLKFHTGETIKVYQCDQCSRTFSQQKNLVQHMKIHIGGDKTYKCSECPASYSYKCHLTRHLMIHSGDKPYKCKFCGKSFNRNAHLIRHRKIHSGEEKQWKCSQCGFAFWEKSDMLRHMKSHEGNRPFKCDFCEQTFVWRRYLLKHLRNNHRADDRHFCQHCCQSFTTGEILAEHERVQHPAKKQLTHTCDVCSEEFYFKYKLDEHMYLHTGRKAHACDKCSMKFVSRKELDRHIAEHAQEVSFCCNTCQKTFSSIDQLQMHVKLHTGSGKYPCSICGASFKWKSQLNSHMVIHSSDFEFTCSVCSKNFKRKRDLTRHVKIYHDTQPPYTCTACNEDFHGPFNLHKHKQEVHWRKIDADDREFACPHCSGVFRIKSDLDRHTSKVHPPRPFVCTICQKRFTMMKFLQKHFELKHEEMEMMEGENYLVVKMEQPDPISEDIAHEENGNQAEDQTGNQDMEMTTVDEVDEVDYSTSHMTAAGNVVVLENIEGMNDSQFETLMATPVKTSDDPHIIAFKHSDQLTEMDTSELEVSNTVSSTSTQGHDISVADSQHQPLSEAITLAHLAQQVSSSGAVPVFLHEVLPSQSQTGSTDSVKDQLATQQHDQQPQKLVIHINPSEPVNTGSQMHNKLKSIIGGQGSVTPDIKTTQQLIQAHVVTIPQPQIVKIQSKPAQSILSSAITKVTNSGQQQQMQWQKISKQAVPQTGTLQANVGTSGIKLVPGIKILPVVQTVNMPTSQQNTQTVSSVGMQLSQDPPVLMYNNAMDTNILTTGTTASTNNHTDNVQNIIFSQAVNLAQSEFTVQEETIEISPQ